MSLFFLLERDFLVGAALDIKNEPKSARKRYIRSTRAKSGEVTKHKSHYCYKIWVYDSMGGRIAIATKYATRADLITTFYYNPATGTKTVHALAFDLDFDKADDRWKTDGKLDWEKIKSFLIEHDLESARAINSVAWSTSGRGIGLTIAISPLELIDENLRAQYSAFTLQNHIIRILSGYGMGADPAASGLIRDQPNYHNPEKLIEYNALQKARVDNSRSSIVTDLLKYTNDHPCIRYQKKSERLDLLWPDVRAEMKLAKLYVELFDNHLNSSWSYSFSQLKSITGLSKSALYRVLISPPPWLKVERLNKYEGYRLALNLEYALYERSIFLLEAPPSPLMGTSGAGSSFVAPAVIKAPSEVQDGERNEYLTNVALTLKHGGIDKAEAEAVMDRVAGEIPGASYSRNCRGFETIVGSIYKNKPGLFGVKDHSSVPSWLLGKIQKGFDKIECPTFFKKGIPEGNSLFCPPFGFKEEKISVIECGECEGSPSRENPPEVSHSAMGDEAKVLDFIRSFSPAAAAQLSCRVDTKAALIREAEAVGKLLHFPAAEPCPESSSPNFVTAIYGDLFTSLPAPAKTRENKYATSYEKNLNEFSDRHPIDRFLAAFDRLMGRFSPRAIYEMLLQVHCDIIAAGHKDKYQGIAAEYLPNRDPFRRIVMAFLLMSFSMQREMLSILSE